MKWTDIPSGQTNRAFQRLMGAFGDDAHTIVERINTNEDMAREIANLCLNYGHEPSTSQVKAREIMGKNMFGVEEAIKHLGVTPSRQQLGYLTEIPFTEEVLTACKDTHILVAVLPLSISDMMRRFEKKNLFSEHRWYINNEFTKNKGEFGWQLVRKAPANYSILLTWDQQQALLSNDEEVPTARIVVYTMIGHLLATGERLLENIFVRCADIINPRNKQPVCIGEFDSKGLVISFFFHSFNRYNNLGLLDARKQ